MEDPVKKHLGIAAVLLSAFLFGVTPVLGKLTYSQGSNPVMLTFLRGFFAVPILFLVLKLRKIPLGITRRDIRDILFIGFLGFAPTGLLLYSAFAYIPVGLATVLHFMFPAIVALAGILCFKSRVTAPKVISLVLGTGGVLLFLERGNSTAATGIVLALASAISYSVYILGVERSSLSRFHYFKLSFYLLICSVTLSGVFALFTNSFTLALTPAAWFYSFVLSMLVAIGAFTLLQIGIVLCGATTASILSTLEPITGVVTGYLVLQETLSLPRLAGCVLIFGAVVLTSVAEAREPSPSAVEAKDTEGAP